LSGAPWQNWYQYLDSTHSGGSAKYFFQIFGDTKLYWGLECKRSLPRARFTSSLSFLDGN